MSFGPRSASGTIRADRTSWTRVALRTLSSILPVGSSRTLSTRDACRTFLSSGARCARFTRVSKVASITLCTTGALCARCALCARNTSSIVVALCALCPLCTLKTNGARGTHCALDTRFASGALRTRSTRRALNTRGTGVAFGALLAGGSTSTERTLRAHVSN